VAGCGAHRAWGWWWHKEPAVGKTQDAIGSEQLNGCGEFEEEEDVSTHPLGNSAEDGERRSGLSPVAHWSGSNGGVQHLFEGEKKKKNGALELLIAEKAGAGRGLRTSGALSASGVAAGTVVRWQTTSGDGTLL
jgi:hypothetical protein